MSGAGRERRRGGRRVKENKTKKAIAIEMAAVERRPTEERRHLRRSTPRRSVSGGGERKKIEKRSEKTVREEEETEKEEGRKERGRRQRGAPAALKRVDARRGCIGTSASPSTAAPCSLSLYLMFTCVFSFCSSFFGTLMCRMPFS